MSRPAAPSDLSRQALAEFIGTALLVAAVVGSGIAAQRLSPDDVGLQLLENTFATVSVLAAVILALGPVSGAHLNPIITLAERGFGAIENRRVAVYIGAQVLGAMTGAVMANVMFSEPALSWSTDARASGGHAVGEVVATAGLLLVVFGLARSGRTSLAPAAVAAWIGGAYWFTSSTSFANPAVTVGRTMSDTFAGIEPASVPVFVAAQLAGLAVGFLCVRALYPDVDEVADQVVLPHEQS